jgi:Peptidase family M28
VLLSDLSVLVVKKMKLNKRIIILFFGLAGITCNQEKSKPVAEVVKPVATLPAPEFNSDSAFAFVKAQCDFGPRVPGTKSHAACADYLVGKLKQYTPDVLVQSGKVTTYNGVNLDIKNIIAQFNVASKKRILLFAHWDTRPWADRDSIREDEPILGADDGGSGVGILLEMARVLSTNSPAIGIDIAFFDAEDYGTKPGEEGHDNSYGLGTQYWCRNPAPAGYKADYGILLDMVGARNAQFGLEGHSKQYAPGVLANVWNAAGRIGFSNYFIYLEGPFFTDDHVYVNELAGIPSIDIIHMSMVTANGFPPHWHTHRDNMDVIDRKTLKAVGQTLLEVIFVSPAI